MPVDNDFRHQVYTSHPPETEFVLQSSPGPEGIPHDATAALGRQLCERGVSEVVLVHGTFRGDDALGLVRALELIWPEAGAWLREQAPHWVDLLVGELGNYSHAYLDRFRGLLGPAASQIHLRRFMWSGENSHAGRADAAIRLLDRLLTSDPAPRHVLLWGHSHAGNIFALMTNLLAGRRRLVQRFFQVCEPYFLSGRIADADRRRWRRVHDALLQHPEASHGIELDIVTFGTPIRYGWESRGYRRLLHITHHRRTDHLPDYLVPFPFPWDDLRTARHGDYVQQLAIAGTDFLWNLTSWSALRVEHGLHGMLEGGLRRIDTLNRLRLGMRVPAEGRTLLIDYAQDADHCREQLLGHAIYTSTAWLPYHFSQVAEHLYEPA